MANIFDSTSRKNSVFIDRRIFDPHHSPSTFNHRESQIRTMVMNLADALEGHIPGNMILYGPSGSLWRQLEEVRGSWRPPKDSRPEKLDFT